MSTVRFYDGRRALDISVSHDALHILILRDDEKQIQFNFFRNDPRSIASRQIERLGMDLRREGYHHLAQRAEQAFKVVQERWYDPDSAFGLMHDTLFSVYLPSLLQTPAERQAMDQLEAEEWRDYTAQLSFRTSQF